MVWVRDGRREDAHRTYAYTRIHRPRPVILISDSVIGFSIPVVKFPSSGPIASFQTRNLTRRSCQKIRDTLDSDEKIRGQNISLSFFFLFFIYLFFFPLRKIRE